MHRPARQYLTRFFAISALLLLCYGGINYIVDPFGIYHTTPDRWIRSRPSIRLAERLHKSHTIQNVHADTLLLGNSRVETGLNPNHPALPKNCYNLALSGADVYECYRYLQHAGALHTPKLVVLGIDWEMFSANAKPAIDFSEARLAVNSHLEPQPGYSLTDLAATLLSKRALFHSIQTLLKQKEAPICYSDGQRDAAVMQACSNPTVVLMASRQYIKDAQVCILQNPDGTNGELDAFRGILRYCRDRRIRLIVFTNPVHAELLDAFRKSPEAYDEWMRRVLISIQREYASTQFWDFCGYNSISEEQLPALSDKTNKMKYYWEISHYRPNVGDFILDRIFGAPSAPDGFGCRVNYINISQDLARLRIEHARFESQALNPGR